MNTAGRECDCCGKVRRDIQACGRDPNGDPDAPAMCFLCRVEYKRGKEFNRKIGKYLTAMCDAEIFP